MSSTQSGPPSFIVFRLSWKDLRHEWILTGCLMLALSAILSPLLIVFGLKEGFISHLRSELVQDPVFREIRPSQTTSLPMAWFDKMRTHPDVAFVVPGILRGASIVRAEFEGRRMAIDMLPTAAGDPLVLDNGGTVPGPSEAVLSAAAADELKADAGDKIRMVVTRTRNAKQETATKELTVAAVLSERADRLPRLYVDLALVVDVEAYREGRGVPSRGWAGSTPTPYLSYDLLYLVASKPLPPTIKPRLRQGTGLTVLEERTPEEFGDAIGLKVDPDAHYYAMRRHNGAATTSNINGVKNRSRGQIDAFLPTVLGMQARLAAAGDDLEPVGEWSEMQPIAGYSISEAAARRVGLPAPPWHAPGPDAGFDEIARIALPTAHPLAEAESVLVEISIRGTEKRLVFPLAVAGSMDAAGPMIPGELAAMLATSRDRAVDYDPAIGSLVLGDPGFRGFRLYAGDIDSAPSLVDEMRSAGIEVIARVDEILRMQALDKGLTGLFLLIAGVGAVGGVAALLASLYAAVERKRQELGMMRLLGLSPKRVFAFPIYQATMIAIGGVALSFAVYHSVGWVLTDTFREELDGAPAVYLSGGYALLVVAVTILAALLSAQAAAIRATRVEPAEAIRAE